MISLFLNELSLIGDINSQSPAVGRKVDAIELVSQLISTLRRGKGNLLVTSFRLMPDALTIEIAPDFTLTNWLADDQVSREERQYLRRHATMLPYVNPSQMEVRYEGFVALGIGNAYYDDGAVLSLRSRDCWIATSLKVMVSTLIAPGDIEEASADVAQVSAPEHWEIQRAAMQARALGKITDGNSLLLEAPIAFPFIDICEGAVRQIQGLHGAERHFNWIRASLKQANDEVAAWTHGDFLHARLPGPASGESRSVLDNPRLKAMRVFTTPYGESEVFQHHMKNLSENKRIHYLFDAQRKKLYIGYVGDHLETAQF